MSTKNQLHCAHNLKMSSHKCENCMRQGDDLTIWMMAKNMFRYKHHLKYYNITSNAPLVYICSSCRRYFFEDGREKACVDYWPAMVYKFLVQENSSIAINVSFDVKWNLVPVKWRRWWREEFAHMLMDEEDGEEVALFVDVTEDYSMALEAIEENKWKSLSKCLDKHFAYPEVRMVCLLTWDENVLYSYVTVPAF